VTNATIAATPRTGRAAITTRQQLTSALLTVTHATITNNRADNDTSGAGTGGGVDQRHATVTLRNTIVARNFVGGFRNGDDDIAGALDGASFNNLIGTAPA
jgi:hypothetical protein